MKRKRLLVISTALIYVFFVLLCLAYAFSLKHVNSEYIVQSNSVRYQKVENLLSGYKNKNLCFLDLDKITTKIEKDPYLKVNKIEKKYPNSINIAVEERKEMFEITYNSEVYVLDENYFILNKKTENGDNILLSLDGSVFDVDSLEIKSTFKFNKHELENCINLMLNLFSDWKNLLSEVKVERVGGEYGQYYDRYSIYFKTIQGSIIKIQDVLEQPEEKVSLAYETYEELSDLEKTDTIVIALKVKEEIKVNKTKLSSNNKGGSK